jgi:hypothetical protein
MVWRLAVIALCLLPVGMPAEAREPKKGAAAEAFTQGSTLYRDGDYVGAIEAFHRSYQLHPHYLTLCNMARCYEKTNDQLRAARHYSRCLEEGGRSSKQASKIQAALKAVEAKLARIKVDSPGEGEVYMDGRSAGKPPIEVPVNPGPHLVEVRRKGHRPARMIVEVRSGESRKVVLRPTPAPKPKPAPVRRPPGLDRLDRDDLDPGPRRDRPVSRRTLHQAWFWGAATVTVGMAVAGTVLGVKTLRANNDYEADPTEDGYDRVLHYRLLTNICWGVAAGAAVGTTALFFFTDFGRKPGEESMVVGVRGSF